MATYSSSLAWRILWTEERGGLQSMGSQRVGHDWATTHFSSFFLLSANAGDVALIPGWETRIPHATGKLSLCTAMKIQHSSQKNKQAKKNQFEEQNKVLAKKRLTSRFLDSIPVLCLVMSNSLQTMDCGLPGSHVHGIFQARMLEWVAISFSRDQTHVSLSWVSCIGSSSFTTELPGKSSLPGWVIMPISDIKLTENNQDQVEWKWWFITHWVWGAHVTCRWKCWVDSCIFRSGFWRYQWRSMPLEGIRVWVIVEAMGVTEVA